jgi:hypothetical protein
MDQFIFHYFWIAFIIVTAANAFIMRARSKKYIQQNPELEAGYSTMFRAIIIYGNIPWVIMGAGILLGLTKSIFSYFFPSQLNPIVLIFHASVIVIWVLSVRWIYFKGGAEMLESHPGLLRTNLSGGNYTAKQIKFFFPIALIGGIAGMVMMWLIKVPEASPLP